MQSQGWLCVDLETTNEEYGSALCATNRLILASWYTEEEGMQTCVGDEFHQRKLIDSIKKASFVIAHNAKFELQWLSRMGVDIAKLIVYDTMLGEWVVAGNRRIPKDLNSTAQRYAVGEKENTVARLIKAGVNPQNIPTDWLAEYCEQDVRITTHIFLKQREVLKERQQLHLQYARCLLTPVLADIEANGVTLDRELVYEEYNRVKEEYSEVERELARLAEKHGMHAINWRSRKQVGEFLYDKLGFEELVGRDKVPLRTDKGQRRTDSGAIQLLRAGTSEQRKFKEAFANLAKLSARLTKSLNFFKTVCDEYDSTFYGIFNQGSTGTHRLSSSGRKIRSKEGEEYSAQLQNLPREYKRLVKAKREGWQILEIDASQLEFRVAAELGRDEVAYEEIVRGEDIHAITARILTESGEPTERQAAKSRTFRPLKLAA